MGVDAQHRRLVTAYVALLRAVNVGGTGKLPMTELKAMAETLGFARVRTYIASGNLIFASALGEGEVKAMLEERLAAYAGKPVGVMVRTAAEMAQVLADDPFGDRPGNHSFAIFLDGAPPADTIATLRHVRDEQVVLGKREVYAWYGEGIGSSKLVIPAAKAGTARNMNSVRKLSELAAEIS